MEKVIKLNKKLPSKIRSKTIEKSSTNNTKKVFNLSSINKIFNKSKLKPDSKKKYLKITKILVTKDTYKMGYGLMKKTSEKGLIRLVKGATGVSE